MTGSDALVFLEVFVSAGSESAEVSVEDSALLAGCSDLME